MYAYCLMPDHVHMIISARDGYDLSGVIRDLKRYTSIAIRKELEQISGNAKVDTWMAVFKGVGEDNPRNANFQFWQQHNHPIELDSVHIYDQRMDYVHNNPVVAELVEDPMKWKWSSARAYELGNDSLVKLTVLE